MVMNVRKYARKIKIAAILLVILIICGVFGQMNLEKVMAETYRNQLPWMVRDNVFVLDVEYGENIEGAINIPDGFVSLKLDCEVYGMEKLPKDASLQIRISSLSAPGNVMEWGYLLQDVKEEEIPLDIRNFKNQEVTLTIWCQGDFEENSGLLLKNLVISKMYTGN